MSNRFQQHMSDSDALMWNIEKDPLLRSTIVAVAMLDRPPEIELLRARFEHVSRTIPRLRQRVLSPPLRLGPPRWTYEPNFDLSYHIRHFRLPAPGSYRQLLDTIAPMAQSSFDRSRPLWECTVIEGVDGDKAAVVLKVHHSVSDGVGGIALLAELVDLDRFAGERAGAPIAHPAEPFGGLDLVIESLAHTSRRWMGIASRMPAMLFGALDATRRDPPAAFGHAVETAASVARTIAPSSAPMSTLLTERSLGRRLDAFDVGLDDLKRAAKAAEGSLNDAFVAAVVGGLDRYHLRHGVPEEELRLTMPINLRREGDAAGGNQFAPARFAVPMRIADPVERMQILGDLVRSWRAEPALGLTDTLAGVLNRLPTSATTALFGGMLRCVDFVTSNVPGAPLPVYFAGAQVERFYAFGPPSGSAVNVTLLSHVDACCIGVVSDTAAIRDPDNLIADMKTGFDEVIAVGR
jgi:diacylglycerol O-acyltransferase